MTEQTPNAELAYKVLDHIDAYPEQWDQGTYIGKVECGTVACFAGWAVLLSGDEPVFYDDLRFASDVHAASGVLVDGHVLMVSERAEALLGASRFVNEGGDDERDLFDQFNTRKDLGCMVAEIFGPRPGAGDVVD
jgi:hypothetical protein